MSSDSFAALFEAQENAAPSGRSVRVGETLEATVAAIGRDTAFLELDGKQQAMLDLTEVLDRDGTCAVRVGDTLRAKVVSVDARSGQVRLGRSLGKGSGDVAHVMRSFELGLPIEGKVTGLNKGGLEIDLGKGLRGFCPLSQIALRPAPVSQDWIGQVHSFLVTEVKEGGRQIVVSRRRLMESEAREARDSALSKLEKGKMVTGTVTAVRDFGAFVDLGGIEGLIPASEIRHERVSSVADHLQAGETVEAMVLDIRDDDKGQKRITLSLKSMLPTPQKSTARPLSKLSIGAVVKGVVVRIENYGVFVQLDGTEGREGRGLVPAAELNVPRGTDLRKHFPEGTSLTAKILETGEGKLKLSVRGAVEASERADYEAHKERLAASASLGTFADLLKKPKK